MSVPTLRFGATVVTVRIDNHLIVDRVAGNAAAHPRQSYRVAAANRAGAGTAIFHHVAQDAGFLLDIGRGHDRLQGPGGFQPRVRRALAGLRAGRGNPRDLKLALARDIAAQYHPKDEASKAVEAFVEEMGAAGLNTGDPGKGRACWLAIGYVLAEERAA